MFLERREKVTPALEASLGRSAQEDDREHESPPLDPEEILELLDFAR